MKTVIAPDSFKGTLSSDEVGSIIKETILNAHPDWDVLNVPVADGGEGTEEAVLKATSARKVSAEVSGPYFEKMTAEYAISYDGSLAVMEMAACAGLPLVKGRMDPSLTTTYGVGEMVNDALKKGVKRIYMGLGGSCTTDGGCGFAAALGVRFFNDKNELFIPTGATLKDICRIEGIEKSINITALCDVDNPLYGLNGASYIFGPQKGADEKMVEELDEGLRHLSSIVTRDLKTSYENNPGAGAAGGLGYGLMSFASAGFRKGIDTVLDIIGFDELIKDADLVITGEGRLDSQSFHGKVIDGIIKRCKGKRVMVIAGSIEENLECDFEIYSTLNNKRKFPENREQAIRNLQETVKEIRF